MSRVVVLVLLAALLAVPASASAAPSCGTKTLYGKTLTLVVKGHGVRCADVPQITAGACKIDLKATWGCFSFRGGPVLVWFRTREMFKEKWSGWIEAVSPPCAQSTVLAADWARATKGLSDAFPSELQVLADDLVRCKQLRGQSWGAVVRLLGKPDESDRVKGSRTGSWLLGDERGYFIQVDSEYLAVRFDRRGRFRSAEIVSF